MKKVSTDIANPWSLVGKKALITGGSSGIGLATAREFLNLGASVLLTSRSSEKLQREVDSFKEEGFDSVFGVAGDVSKVSDREKIIKEVTTVNKGKLHILVNNVGLNIRKKTQDFTDDDIQKVFFGLAVEITAT